MDQRLRSEINVTPLVDIVLVLLIVFMTLVPALPRALSAALPKPRGREAPPLPLLRLTLTREGQLKVGDQPDESLSEALARHPGRIHLRVHPDLPFGAPVRVLDEIENLQPGVQVALTAWPG